MARKWPGRCGWLPFLETAPRYARSMEFERDPEKAASNLKKHDVPFDEAATASGDPLSLTIADPDHSDDEDRFILLGQTFAGRLCGRDSYLPGRENPDYQR